MADLPFPLPAPLASRLASALDLEQKLPRALEALGPLAGRDVGVLDLEDGIHTARLAELGITARPFTVQDPFRLDAPDASLDALVALWTGIREPEPAVVAETDRVLRPGGRLLVVHDYGRDEVSTLRPADAPELARWSRREGPYLQAGFKIRVLHCFWTFSSIEEAQTFLVDAFGEPGRALGESLRRARLTWNVAIYHRWRGGVQPDGDDAHLTAAADTGATAGAREAAGA